MKAASLLFLFAIFLGFSIDLYAQVNRGISAAGRRMDDWDTTRSKADRDAMDREMRGKKPTKDQLQNSARIKTETREDLEGLQRHYNDIILKLSGGQTPEDAFTIEAASRVSKHANRLKANIVFPKTEKENAAKPTGVAGDTRKRLRELSTHIYEFLTNPMIENPNVLDLEAARAAQKLLDAIIRLSDQTAKN